MNASLTKLQLYKSLFSLNRAFTLLSLNCERLQSLGFFRSEYLRGWQVTVQHLQAQANTELIETLQEWEHEEAFRFDQLQRDWEDQFKDPNDVLILADDRKQQIKEQIRDLQSIQRLRRRGKKKRK